MSKSSASKGKGAVSSSGWIKPRPLSSTSSAPKVVVWDSQALREEEENEPVTEAERTARLLKDFDYVEPGERAELRRRKQQSKFDFVDRDTFKKTSPPPVSAEWSVFSVQRRANPKKVLDSGDNAANWIDMESKSRALPMPTYLGEIKREREFPLFCSASSKTKEGAPNVIRDVIPPLPPVPPTMLPFPENNYRPAENTSTPKRPTFLESKKRREIEDSRSRKTKTYAEIGDFTAALIEDFDVLPERTVDEDLKYRAVRKKDERALLTGWACHQCRDYYEDLAKEMHPSEVQRLMDKCSKHRSNNPAHYQSFTPPGAWDTTMPSTEEALEKGILKYVDASPPVRRKRHDLLD